MFDFHSFCSDFSIPTSTQSPNSAPGWTQVQCPFCSDHSDHLGFNLNTGFLNCWRCGYHTNLQFIQTLARCNWEKAKILLKHYETEYKPFKKEKIKHADSLNLDFAGKLTKSQRKYLEKRNYDPDKLIKTWGIKGTGPVGDYKHRIIAPITYNKTLVSFTGRDYTDKAELRYKSCKKEKEVIHHKRILYGLDKAKGHKCIVVEGVTDVWRIGPGAVAVFGINFRPHQMYLIAERFSKVFIMFDEGYQAQEKALKLGTGLSMLGIETERCLIKGDPGALPQAVANSYRKELLG